MCVSRRRAVLRSLTALAIGAVVLTGCGGDKADSSASETSATTTDTTDETVSDTTSGGDTDPEEEAVESDDAAADDEAATDEDAGSDGEAATGDAAAWAGTKQFVQIEDVWSEEGQTLLSVRAAEKEAMTEPHEAWIIIPSEGPYTTVALTEDAQVLLSVPLGDESAAAEYSQEELVSRFAEQPESAIPGLGYDLSFDGDGQVTRLETLYMS
ncbi:hypothetical protein RM844_20385 [Streptomyces sp. DSM 44915]|uniref:Lipoprotein n=1 Tax=Streptomyces chisholmiae TaxID=3075540 RepID=A0ABU2JUI8_9ACTN|nr:hypothetical protein [Streptomyces sp. DSM 44915]MDT0268647.1 hypothetical protein [Streptomyces sp. DSM 44915]